MIDKRGNDAEREKKLNVQSSDYGDLAKRRGHCYLIIHTAQVIACEGRQMSWNNHGRMNPTRWTCGPITFEKQIGGNHEKKYGHH